MEVTVRLDRIEIKNFRCFDQFELAIGGRSLFVVSENAAGKSSLLAAIAKALGRERSIALADFADPSQPIEIATMLSGFELADQALFPSELTFKGPPTLSVGIRAVWDPAEGDADVTVGFPEHGWKRLSRDQRESLRLLWLPASRDPSRILQLAAARSLLGQLIADLELGGSVDAALAEISDALATLAKVPDVANLLSQARNELAGLIPGVEADAFSLGAEEVSGRDLFREFQLMLAHSGPALPVSKQSDGLGQLAIFVFAFRTLTQESKAILLVDEPEIALHPQAQRALVSAMRKLPNQSIVATHSSNVLDRADPRTILRLHRSAGKVTGARPATLSDDDAEWLSRFANPQTTEACFARKAVLVEGYSDRIALLRLSSRLGRDLDAEGISILSLEGGSAIAAHLQLLGKAGLGLEVCGLCDEDKELKWQKELNKVRLPVTDRASMQAAGFFVCVKDLEHEFIRALGLAGVQALIAKEKEDGAFAKFAAQPAHASEPRDEQLRRFLHGDNVRWASPLVDALDLKAIPGPLSDLIGQL